MHISLTPTLEEYTRKKVESGLYNNASEVIRESLRLMLQRDKNAETLRESVTRGFEQVEAGQFTEVTSERQFMELARGRR